MKFIKHIVCIAIALLSVSELCAKDKIVERSAKKVPEWIGQVGNDRIFVQARANDIDEAISMCMDEVKRQIVNSVASNITSVELNDIRYRSSGSSEELVSEYSSRFRTVAAKLPFITDISVSSCLDYYWEKKLDKKTGYAYYDYYLLYPFPEITRRDLIGKFMAYDSEKQRSLDNLKERLGSIASVSEIRGGIMEAESLMTYFFDDSRSAEAKAVYSSYREAYSAIQFRVISEKRGTMVYDLSLDGRRIDPEQIPSLRSETATELRVFEDTDGTFILSYDDRYCYPQDDNIIEIVYTFPGRKLRYRYHINIEY